MKKPSHVVNTYGSSSVRAQERDPCYHRNKACQHRAEKLEEKVVMLLPDSVHATRWKAYKTWSPLLADIKNEFMEFSVAKALWTSIRTAAMCFKSSTRTGRDYNILY